MDAQVHPETLEETVPPVLGKAYYSGTSVIEQYGWYLLGGALLLWYSWNKLRDMLYKWQAEREERKFAAKCHKDPDLVRQRQEALELARLRMQEEYKKQAEIAAERQKQREQQRKEENLQRHKDIKWHPRLGGDNDDTLTKRNKPSSNAHQEYNPLMGSGGSGGYHPPRRTCPGGGCG